MLIYVYINCKLFILNKNYYLFISRETILSWLSLTIKKPATFASTFLDCYLAAPHPIFCHCWRGSLTYPMLMTTFLHNLFESHQESLNKVGYLNPGKHLMGFERGTFRFWLQQLSPLTIKAIQPPLSADHAMSKYKPSRNENWHAAHGLPQKHYIFIFPG